MVLLSVNKSQVKYNKSKSKIADYNYVYITTFWSKIWIKKVPSRARSISWSDVLFHFILSLNYIVLFFKEAKRDLPNKDKKFPHFSLMFVAMKVWLINSKQRKVKVWMDENNLFYLTLLQFIFPTPNYVSIKLFALGTNATLAEKVTKLNVYVVTVCILHQILPTQR